MTKQPDGCLRDQGTSDGDPVERNLFDRGGGGRVECVNGFARVGGHLADDVSLHFKFPPHQIAASVGSYQEEAGGAGRLAEGGGDPFGAEQVGSQVAGEAGVFQSLTCGRTDGGQSDCAKRPAVEPGSPQTFGEAPHAVGTGEHDPVEGVGLTDRIIEGLP